MPTSTKGEGRGGRFFYLAGVGNRLPLLGLEIGTPGKQGGPRPCLQSEGIGPGQGLASSCGR